MKTAGVLVMVLGLVSLAQGAVLVSDHFDNGVLDPAWVVSYDKTDGYVGEESGTNYTVSNINRVVYDDWNTVRLTQSLSTPLTRNFQVNFDFSWAMEHPAAMQIVSVRLLDSNDVEILGTGMVDAWGGTYGSIFWGIGSTSGHTGSDSQPAAGVGNIVIVRENGNVSITYNGNPLASGETTGTIAKVQIAFARYFYSGVPYYPMSVDRVEVVAVGSQPLPVYGPNLVQNGEFSTGLTNWNYWATNGRVFDIYGAFGSTTQWDAPAEANSCGSVSLDSVSGNPTPSILVTHAASESGDGLFGAIGNYQVVKVIPGAKYIVNADWKSSTGLPPNCWAEFIVYNATQAEVDNPSQILVNVNDTFPQNCIVAKKDSWPNLNGGAYAWDWQPITLSMSGGFDHAAGTNVLTATENYMVLLTKFGGTFLSEANFQIDNVKLQLCSVPGDANNDGKVNVSDLGILATNYGALVGATWSTGDFNGDGKVNVSDLGILATNYGYGMGQAMNFAQDAKAVGLLAGDDVVSAPTGSPDLQGPPENTQKTEVQAENTPEVKSFGGCGSAGLPLMAGLFMMGLLLIKVEE